MYIILILVNAILLVEWLLSHSGATDEYSAVLFYSCQYTYVLLSERKCLTSKSY